MKLVSLKCPECKADLSVEPGRKQCFCQYCGTKIIIDNEEQVQTFKTVDEARIREAELQNELKLKQMEIERERQEADRKRKDANRSLKIKVCIGLVIVALFSFIADKIVKDSSFWWLTYMSCIGIVALAISIFSSGDGNDGYNNKGNNKKKKDNN